MRRVRSRALAVFITFGVSAIVHEYIFSIAVGRVQGYPTAFFLVQGAAVAVTAGWKPKGWQAVLAVAGTLVFLLLSSILFFASFHGLVTFYSGSLPTRLPAW